jgi:YidC/Oxa1 family membrane protein insertase
MISQNIKYILWIIVFLAFFILFNSWENDKKILEELKDKTEDFNLSVLDNTIDETNKIDFTYETNLNTDILVNTDLVCAKINSKNGDINYLSLKKYKKNILDDDGVVVFDKNNKNYYIQSGIINLNIDKFLTSKLDYEIKSDDSALYVILKYDSNDFILYKIYTFKNFSYEIGIDFFIKNKNDSDLLIRNYGLIENKQEKIESSFFGYNIRSYEGFALNTENKIYKKLHFEDISNNNFFCSKNSGWMAMIENHFVSVWMPSDYYKYTYKAYKDIKNVFKLKYFNSSDLIIPSGRSKYIESILFSGPKSTHLLNNLPFGVNLMIDYGIFWPIASPIFFTLDNVYYYVKNWGISIILITFFIKILFFNLSSMSYRSISNMKKLQPKIDILKDIHKDNKTQLSHSIMDLYKKEKVNPLGGCLPIIIQIPVFISLYYVILESVELRHAPFFLWINDLSSKDSYYVLPVLMSITMFIQQKMNPPIQDPIQAKIILFMPLIFLLLFLQFPSGLVLYWIVNNTLSIIQQWIIMKKFT